MKKSFVTAVFTGIVAAAATAAPLSDAYAQSVCYKWDIFPDERIVLDVERHSILVKPYRPFGEMQTAYSVHGKHAFAWEGASLMAAATGTVVVSSPTSSTNGGHYGAHLGLESEWVRGDGEFWGDMFAQPVDFDCTTDEISATPKTWHCETSNEFGVYHGDSHLHMVWDDACKIFQNGHFGDLNGEALKAAVAAAGGKASMVKIAK
jgi:hypothetical protein